MVRWRRSRAARKRCGYLRPLKSRPSAVANQRYKSVVTRGTDHHAHPHADVSFLLSLSLPSLRQAPDEYKRFVDSSASAKQISCWSRETGVSAPLPANEVRVCCAVGLPAQDEQPIDQPLDSCRCCSEPLAARQHISAGLFR